MQTILPKMEISVYIIEEGCKFPPIEVAARFSYETSVPENQGLTPFGFHLNLPPTIKIEE